MNKLTALQTLINKQKTSHLFDIDDPDELVQAVNSIAQKQGELAKLGLELNLSAEQITEIAQRIQSTLLDRENAPANIWGILNEHSIPAEELLTELIENHNSKVSKNLKDGARIYRRRTNGDTCDWCTRLAGDWAHPFASNGVGLFVRHKGCDCEFSIVPADEFDEPPEIEELTPAEIEISAE